VAQPLTMEQALQAGGLDWKISERDLQTCEDPPSPTTKRKALVRLDREPGDPERVLGVVHLGFKPLQNRDGAQLFDAIFGDGKAVYHTGGYLGSGEVVWLMAKIEKTLTIGEGDLVQPYALFANSHDGSEAFSICLTTVRVVCQNTLKLALREKGLGEQFRRSHQSTFLEHAEAAADFWASTMRQLDRVAESFKGLASATCDDKEFAVFLDRLLPIPPKPRTADRNKAVMKAWDTRVDEAKKARNEIERLRTEQKGAELKTAHGTLWGALNAVTEYVDHHRECKADRVAYALLGDGMDLKLKAYKLIRDVNNTTAV
jgi:phage/plasmid-like protein (TIGR03299 family)